jgi:hypothetical protein
MVQIVLQIAAAGVLVVLIIQVGTTVGQQNQREWQVILADFQSGHGELVRLSNVSQSKEMFSASEIWAVLNGMRGLWRVYSNLQVLIEIVDFVAMQCPSDSRVWERLKSVRADVTKARKTARLLLIRRLAVPFELPCAKSSITAYLGAVRNVSGVLEEFFPNRLRSYHYFVSRGRLDVRL